MWGRRGAALLIFIAVVEYLVIPQLVGTRDAVDLLGKLQPALVAGLPRQRHHRPVHPAPDRRIG